MLLDQTLLISISFSCVITILLFLYFKRKITSLEFKLDSLFKLIEQHTAEQKNQAQPLYPQQGYGSAMTEQAQTTHEEEKRIINLIPVSDNELSSSDEEFTTEEEGEEEEGEYYDDQQSIKDEVSNELNSASAYLEGAESKLVNLQTLEDVEPVDIDTIQQLGNQMEEELTQNVLQKIEVVKDDAEEVVSIHDEELEEDLSDLSELEDEEVVSKIVEITGDHEELKNELKNVNVSKLTAPKLRDLVKKYNLVEDSKKLKKNELIELLQKYQ